MITVPYMLFVLGAVCLHEWPHQTRLIMPTEAYFSKEFAATLQTKSIFLDQMLDMIGDISTYRLDPPKHIAPCPALV